jgi:hypothetical protein
MPCGADLERHGFELAGDTGRADHTRGAAGPGVLPGELENSLAEPALDLHGAIDDPAAGKCPRTPEHRRLLNHSTGELHPVRCKATNLCDYCARLSAIETSEMLLLDALEDAPTLYVVLTARELLEKPACRRHLTQLRRSLRDRWPDVRWAVLAEFQKRGALHLNLLVKGVPPADLEEFHAAITAAWCRRVDAEPAGQWSDVMADRVGVVQYVTLHFMKPAQAPPKGWRGHRFSCTRDYLVRPASVMREEARQSLRLKRAIWRAERAGLEGSDALSAAELELAAANATTWTLRSVNPSTVALDPPAPAPPSELTTAELHERLELLEDRPSDRICALLEAERYLAAPPVRQHGERLSRRARADVNPAQRASERRPGTVTRVSVGPPRPASESPGRDRSPFA